MRDEFSTETKSQLALQANYQCSFEECGQITSGPSDAEFSGAIKLGEAAHISAASPGGPRYDPEMPARIRASLQNGIWLCRHHAGLIDKASEDYTVECIQLMKAKHLSRVYKELHSGRKSPNSASHDLISIGPGNVFVGTPISVGSTEWVVSIEHFVIGDLSSLRTYIDSYVGAALQERYVLVNALDEGRELSAAPILRFGDRIELVCQVAPPASRIRAQDLPKDLRLSNSGDFGSGGGDIATISGLEALPQKLRNNLSTARGELFFHPDFGGHIQAYFKRWASHPGSAH